MTARTQPVVGTTAAASASGPSAWSGWVLFGALMLILNGVITIIQGLVALVDEGYFLVRAGDHLLVTSYDVWGGILLFWGGLLFLTGLSVATGRGWARWVAMFVAAGGAVIQIGFLAAYPIWSALVIVFDVLVLFALAAHWDEVQKVA
jgi:hypothetical protein